MIPIYVCDDDPALRAHVAGIAQRQVLIESLDFGPVQTAADPQALLALAQSGARPAVYFLDIDFPGFENGLKLATRLRALDPRGFLVFVTSYRDLAFETFRYRLEAMDFIVKGDDAALAERIRACLLSIRDRLCDSGAEEGFFTLRLLDTIRHIRVASAVYFEAVGMRHLVRLHLDGEVIDFNDSLSRLEQELGGVFWRCHRSFLVNRARVAKIHLRERLVEMDSGETCLLSRKEKAACARNGMA